MKNCISRFCLLALLLLMTIVPVRAEIIGQTLVASVAPYGATATITWYRDDSKVLSYGATYTVQADDIGYSIYVWAEGTGNTTGSATSRITSEVKAN